MIELIIKQTSAYTITLTNLNAEVGIPFDLYCMDPRSLRLYIAMGCLACARFDYAVNITNCTPGKRVSKKEALYYGSTDHPEIEQIQTDGFTVYCPLLSDRNVHSHLRDEPPPCLTKGKITI